MSRIKGKNTKPEEIVRKYLFSKGFRYRKNDTRYPGTPDIVLPKYKTMIFVNGCFGHGHEGCRFFVIPQTNTSFWLHKTNAKRERDQSVREQLRKDGWNVITIWECQLKKDHRSETLHALEDDIKSKLL